VAVDVPPPTSVSEVVDAACKLERLLAPLVGLVSPLDAQIRALGQQPAGSQQASSPGPIKPLTDTQDRTIDEKRAVQQALRALGHYRGAVDDGFGVGTLDAIREFQSFEGHAMTETLTDAEQRDLLEKAQYLAALLDQGAKSPLGVSGQTVEGTAQRCRCAGQVGRRKRVRTAPRHGSRIRKWLPCRPHMG
jgi:Putative peptidoglycan binding domain